MNREEVSGAVIKSGEEVSRITICRSARGADVLVKLHPTIEQMVQGWGNGEIADVKIYSRGWQQIGEQSLNVYNLTKSPGLLPLDDAGGGLYRIDIPGQAPLIQSDGAVRQIVNLSFVRLVGASEGLGVRFSIKGVYTMEEITRLKDFLGSAIRRFYVSFLKPVELTVKLYTEGR